jgi:trehalose-6-phosphate synthase
MNLVCKEFVASRIDGEGVLVLSEFAGAAVELSDALIVNPFSNRAMDRGILQALEMDGMERRHRMERLRAAVAENDLSRWGPGRLSVASGPKRAA